MQIEVIATGAELLDGRGADTNARLLARALRPVGARLTRATIVGDGIDDIAAALREALPRADAVIVTGGLGPTVDDRTRDAAALVFDAPLIEDEPTLTALQGWFRGFGREMKDNNRRQAQFPRGATIVPNPIGTAAGFVIDQGGRVVLFAPGVPRELELMAAEQFAPFLRQRFGVTETITVIVLRTFGFTESGLDHRLAQLDLGDVELAFTASIPEINVTLTARDADPAAAAARVAAARALIDPVLGLSTISDDGRTLEEVVADLMTARKLTLALAESCTGGLIAGRCTNVPGSSNWFLEGAVTYSNDAKVRRLGVPAELIAAHGAVSREVAEAMAAGIRRTAGADLGLGVTGVAGPGGGTPAKPVGTVHMALAHAGGVEHWLDKSWGDRARVRMFAAEQALDRLRRHLLA
jgi:nicotinamide-nucleotide amidase